MPPPDREKKTGKPGAIDLGSDQQPKRTRSSVTMPEGEKVAPRKTTTGQIPVQRATTGSMEKLAPESAPRRPTNVEMPLVAEPSITHGNAIALPTAPSAPKQLTQVQKQQLDSGFSDARREQKLQAVLGNTRSLSHSGADEDEGESTLFGVQYDGDIPAKQLIGRDLWKAVQAPVQSREGRRSAEAYGLVIAQFAVGANPRYEPDAPDRPRGHIFVWDVSRAMNCEVPHFVGAKELSLAQTCDWLRHEGPMRGWARLGMMEAVEAALQGRMVIAAPKEVKLKQLAIVLPEEDFGADQKPLVAAAARVRGKRVKLSDALGVFAAEFFVHP